MNLERFIEALDPTEIARAAPVDVLDLGYDTRSVEPGTLFFCVRGEHADGHAFAATAAAAGAVALVVDHLLDVDLPQLVVADVRGAMAPAATLFFGDPTRELEVAAITGTNGKTTTAFLLRSILEAAGRQPALLTNIERRVGGELLPSGLNTPEAIDLQRLFRQMLDAGDRSCVMEATSIAQVQGRLGGTRFAVLVFTNLTQDHLDFHGTMEEYFQAKRRLFAQAERAVVNVGDEYGRRLAAELPDAVTFDAGSPALDGIDFKLRGRFNRENAIGAALAAKALGVDDEAIRRGLESVAGVPGRFEAIDEGQDFTVIVDYAHTPDSLENVLRAARGLGAGRLAVVFGAGGDRDREKRPMMGRVVSELADRAILTSDNPRSEDPAEIAAEVADGLLGARRGPARPPRRDRPRAPGSPCGRRGRDRRPRRRADAGARKRQGPLRRPGGDARGAANARRDAVIPLPLSLVEPLGQLHARPWAEAVTGLAIDSRRVEEGDLFVAVGGGADFVPHALARGAAAALVPNDAHAALATIAGAVRDRSQARVVGITGATGKTTTKDILAALCAPHARTIASEANYNNELGVPLTLCRIEPETEICIVEMGMRGLGQIAWLASFAKPDIGVITNIAPVHLELVETVENVARAKAELIAALAPGGIAVVPGDEPLLEPYLTRTDIEIRRFGEVDEPGVFRVGERTIRLATNYASRHQLRNTLAALTVCDALGLDVADGSLEVEFSPLREEELELGRGVTLINDCYNANPLSMRAALEHLAQRAGDRRRVAVLGEMAELGENATAYHREVGAAAAEAGVDELVAVGELARSYGGNSTWFATAAEAADAVAGLVRDGDVVLVKGSRAVGLEAVAAKLTG